MSMVPSPGAEEWRDNPIVNFAEQQLRAYGEYVRYGTLTRAVAEELLPYWSHYREMSAREIAATLARFGRPEHGNAVELDRDEHTDIARYSPDGEAAPVFCGDCGQPLQGLPLADTGRVWSHVEPPVDGWHAAYPAPDDSAGGAS